MKSKGFATNKRSLEEVRFVLNQCDVELCQEQCSFFPILGLIFLVRKVKSKNFNKLKKTSMIIGLAVNTKITLLDHSYNKKQQF